MRLGCVAIGFTIYPGSATPRPCTNNCARPRRGQSLRVGRGGVVVPTGHEPFQGGRDGAGRGRLRRPHCRGTRRARHQGEAAHGTSSSPRPRRLTKKLTSRATLAERVRHVVQATFDGHRIVIFSGGPKKDSDEAVFDEARAIRDGGGFGSIIGRNSFQRKKEDTLKFLSTVDARHLRRLRYRVSLSLELTCPACRTNTSRRSLRPPSRRERVAITGFS